jgi:DNA-binding NarL/FixJ family response regulator
MSDKAMSRAASALERIGMVLGALYAAQLKNEDQGSKAVRLKSCGFANADIAEILGTTKNTINVALSIQKRKVRKKNVRKTASRKSRKAAKKKSSR